MVRKKNRQKVQVAIARKILVVIWNILEKGVVYSDVLEKDKTKDKQIIVATCGVYDIRSAARSLYLYGDTMFANRLTLQTA